MEETDFSEGPSDELQENLLNIKLYMLESLEDVEKRNEALLFRNGTQPAKGLLRSMVSDVLVSSPIQMEFVNYSKR